MRNRFSTVCLTLLCALSACPAVLAVDDIVISDEVAAQINPGANQNAFAVQQQIMVNQNQNPTLVDQWLFARNQTAGVRKTMEAPLNRQLSELKSRCSLSGPQAEKLVMAMQCDVDRFFDDVDALREKYPEPFVGGVIRQEMQQDILNVQQRYRNGSGNNLCGPNSFFEKTLKHTLDRQQQSTYRQLIDERLRRRYIIAIETSLLDLEDRVPLNDRQHRAIRDLLAHRALAPTMHKSAELTTLVMYRMAQLTSDDLQPLFEKERWQAFNQDRFRFRGYHEHLRQTGMLVPYE